MNGVEKPSLIGFSIDKPIEYKILKVPKRIHYRKTNKSLINVIGFYLEEYKNIKVDFIVETLIFTLILIRKLIKKGFQQIYS